MNAIAKDAQRDLKAMLPRVIDKPAAFTMKAIKYQTTQLDITNLRDGESRVFVLDTQSTYLKYLMEGGTRLPGDIGPSDDFIYVALWAATGCRSSSKTAQRAPVGPTGR